MRETFLSTSSLTPGTSSLTLTDLIGNRRPYGEIATVLGCTERSVYTLVDKYRIPYIRVLGRRYVDPEAFRDALTREQALAPARGRGRPPKAA